MNTSDRREFKRVLTRLGAVFGKAIDEDLLEAYFTALSPLSLDVVRRACDTATADHKGYFPQPAELREYAQASVPRERPSYREIDGERVYECFRCMDLGVELRTDKWGTHGTPCLCPQGESVRRSWEKPNSQGGIMAETARDNVERHRRFNRATEEPAA